MKKIKIERERTLSIKGAQAERLKAQKARENVKRMQQESMEKENCEESGEGEGESLNQEDSDESDQHDGLAQISEGEEDHRDMGEHLLPAELVGMEESDGFVFAIHRRTVRMGIYGEVVWRGERDSK